MRWIALLTLCLCTTTTAAINVEFRCDDPMVVGETVSVEVYLVSDDETHQLASDEIIITWDIFALQLEGAADNPALPINPFFAMFPDFLPLNDSLIDGNAMYIALAWGGDPIIATQSGTLLTTFTFTVLSDGETFVDVPAATADPLGVTVIWSGEIPNLPVTGMLTGTVIGGPVQPEPCGADLDGDGVVGIVDLLMLLSEWGT